MRQLAIRLVAVLAVALAAGGFALAPAAPALADKPDHAGKPAHAETGKGRGKADKDDGGGHGRDHGPSRARGDDVSIDVDIVFGDAERSRIHDHYRDGYGDRSCPPGLAKKRNGCLPPGQAKKIYGRGDAIPDGVVLLPLPGRLEVRLGTLPRGYVYRYVDGQVLVVAEAAKKVIDAVVLLSSL